MLSLKPLIFISILLLTLARAEIVSAQDIFNRLQNQLEQNKKRQELIQKQEENLKKLKNFKLNLESNGELNITNTPTPITDPDIIENINSIKSPVEISIPPSGDITYSQSVLNSVANCANAQNIAIYKQAESVTGVPWKALAAIHYMEGNCNIDQSLVSGRRIGSIEPDIGNKCSSDDVGLGKPYPLGGGCVFRNILDTAVYAGFHLKNNKFNGQIPKTVEDLAYAFGRYNGTGNRNCGRTPYQFCPPAFDNDDHIYAMSKYSKKHETMYLVYCADRTTCNPPQIFQRIGALAVINILNSRGL